MIGEKKDGKIPTLHIVDDSIPGAFWHIITRLDREGYPLRTEYDRRNSSGEYIDKKTGRDARVLIEIKNPFSRPRFPAITYSEIGKYIAEIRGVKDHLVTPYDELFRLTSEARKKGTKITTNIWPYTYSKRLTAYPAPNGETINQLEEIVKSLAKSPLTRRAVAITGIPAIDLYITEDQPCLREIQLRAIENRDGKLVLNMFTRWRSRDAYKAWPDNVIGLTHLFAKLARDLEEKSGREVLVGTYSEECGSLHIYPQDYSDPTKSIESCVLRFKTKEEFLEKSKNFDRHAQEIVIDQIKELKSESVWRFPEEALKTLDELIEDFSSGRLIA